MNSTLRGKIFEVIVQLLLKRNGYSEIIDDDQTIKKGKIKGRGVWHQIDAYGRLSYVVPFIFPVRLIAEAKWYEGKRKTAGLSVVRNFVGMIKDISENYFIEDGQRFDDKILLKRFTECGSIFSVNGFSPDAQKYAYVQGVSLISYENHPIMADIIDTIRPMLQMINSRTAVKKQTEFTTWFCSQISNTSLPRESRFVSNEEFYDKLNDLRDLFDKIHSSVIGIASGTYPIHLLSYKKLPDELVSESDNTNCTISYLEGTENVLIIKPSDAPDVELFCSIPRYLILRYVSQMLKFKKKFFEYIDIPMKVKNMRRIIRLNLDPEWLTELEDEAQTINRTR